MKNPRKILNGFRRRLYRKLRLHPTSYPYLSGDSFRSLANHIHDMDSNIIPSEVEAGDILFVQSPKMEEFFTAIKPQIKAKFVLITHNGDENITEQYLPFIDENIKHWFAQNCLVTHPKITPLPIGLENKWYWLHGIPSYFNKLRKKNIPKQSKILYKFNVATNPAARGEAMKELEKHPLAETYNDWRESYRYLATLQNYGFVASPPGNGEDCHRTWEAMYLGTIPILKRSASSDFFSSLNLPIIVIDNWSEIANFDQEKLEQIYVTMTPKFAEPALWADFWIKLITTKSNL